MRYRSLGKTGIQVSEIGLGTAQIGGASFIGNRYIGAPKISTSDALSLLEHAFDSGITFYDSSDKYGDGESERLLAQAFSRRRGKVVLATKCGITASGGRCFTRTYVRSCCEASLRNLNTDYIDVFQLTKPDIAIIQSGHIYDTLDELKREGKIRYSGISTGTVEETMQLISDRRVDSLQIFYNLLHVSPNELFIGKAFDAGIGLIVRSPLSSGLLTGKFTARTKFAKEDNRSNFLRGRTLVSRISMIRLIEHRFKLDKNHTIMDMSLNYLLSNDRISCIIPGASRLDQLAGILRLCTVRRMEPRIFSEVEAFIRDNYDED